MTMPQEVHLSPVTREGGRLSFHFTCLIYEGRMYVAFVPETPYELFMADLNLYLFLSQHFFVGSTENHKSARKTVHSCQSRFIAQHNET